MCGIIGAVKRNTCVEDLINGLRHVEYRGYDSAGVSVHQGGVIHTIKREGCLDNLDQALKNNTLSGQTGIGHTRWATHGNPSSANAHPHATSLVSVVHNGIIENHLQIRDRLKAEGCVFSSDTDSEVIPHLISLYLALGYSCEAACQAAINDLHGSFALGILFKEAPDMLMAARRGSPLVIGKSKDAMYLGSDCIALSGLADDVLFMEEGDWAMIDSQQLELHDLNGATICRDFVENTALKHSTDKADHPHYMHKEIHEQPDAIRKTLFHTQQTLWDFPFDLKKTHRLHLIACGSSYYAAQVARYWFEHYAGLPVEVDIASEYRYRDPSLDDNDLALFISQSGETADTLAALHYTRLHGIPTVAMVNVTHSSMARDADFVLPLQAGPEIGVASTKAFTCQLAALANLAIRAAVVREHVSPREAYTLIASLACVPQTIEQIVQSEADYQRTATYLSSCRDAYFIGRGTSYPIAMEGALKLKEISYIHAEGYGAGELKHGPIALISENVPIIVIAPDDKLTDKTLSNMQEVTARGGRCILLTDAQVLNRLPHRPDHILQLPVSTPLSAPLLYAVALQLLAYYVARARGTNVDQPRNLAKSVTVE